MNAKTDIRGMLLIAMASVLFCGCTKRDTRLPADEALARQIGQLVETFLMSDSDAETERALAEAKAIFEREGIPSVGRVGDSSSYGFVLINMLGQSPDFQVGFMARVREAAARHELPEDAVLFAEARLRQTETKERFRNHSPGNAPLRDEILHLYKADQSVRQKTGFDARKMEQTDRELAGPLRAMFQRYGVPTYDLVGVEAANAFVVMVQHQSPEFRQAVLSKLKSNVDAGQGDAGTFAMVYDRTQRDQRKKQLYGEQLECSQGSSLSEAPVEDASNVDLRRARLGLMRIELYARLVRLHSPDMCGSTSH
jgi:hypothetical protein